MYRATLCEEALCLDCEEAMDKLASEEATALAYEEAMGVTYERGGVGGALVESTPFVRKGHEFNSRSSRHVRTLGKSFTHSCLWRFGVKLQHSISAVSAALLSSCGLEEAL